MNSSSLNIKRMHTAPEVQTLKLCLYTRSQKPNNTKALFWGSFWQLLIPQKAQKPRSSPRVASSSRQKLQKLNFVIKAEKLPQSSLASFSRKLSPGGAFTKLQLPQKGTNSIVP